MLWAFAVVSALMSLLASIVLLYKWRVEKTTSLLLWSAGMFSYFLSHLLEAYLILMPLDHTTTAYLAVYFIRQSLVSVMLVFLYSGIIGIITTRHFWLKVMPISLFFAQEGLIGYIDFVLKDTILSPALHIILFVIPLSLLFGVLFSIMYSHLKRKGLLLIGLSWFSYAIIVPFYFLLKGTPLLPYWFLGRAITVALLVIGFLELTLSNRHTELYAKHLGNEK